MLTPLPGAVRNRCGAGTLQTHRLIGRGEVVDWQIALGFALGALGLVLSVLLQLVVSHMTTRREREARLFDARRQVYAEALREIGNRWHVPIEEPARVTQDDLNELRSYILGSEVLLVGSPEVRETFTNLMRLLHGALEAHRGGDRDKVNSLVREVGEIGKELRTVMHADLGVERAVT